MIAKVKHILTALLTAVLLTALPSCITESRGDCEPSGVQDGDVVVTFNLFTNAPVVGSRSGLDSAMGGLSRADSDDTHREVESDFPSVEDVININDFAFYLFIGTGDDARLLMANTTIGQSDNSEDMISGSAGLYTVQAVIRHDDFVAAFGSEPDPNSTERVPLRLAVIANSHGTRSATTSLCADLSGISTYKDFIDKAQELTMRLHRSNFFFSTMDITTGDLSLPTGMADNISTLPGLIPMFGVADVTVTQRQLATTNPAERLYLGDISLLRALAKFQVIDNIQNRTDGYPVVKGCRLNYHTCGVHILPNDALNYKPGTQVHAPNRFHAEDGIQTADMLSGRRSLTVTDALGTSVTGTSRLIYVPEQPMSEMSVTVLIQTNANPASIRQYEIPLTGYNGQSFTWGAYMLRNHIYTLAINSVTLGVNGAITVIAADWKPKEFYFDYTDNPSIPPNGYVQWQSGYDGIPDDGNTGIVTFKPVDGNETPTLVGSFHLPYPVGGEWIASLTPLDGLSGVFMFRDSDGNLHNSISGACGTIDGDDTKTITIISTETAPAQINRARLQIMVRLGDGTYIDVSDKLGAQGSRPWIINQNAKQ